MPEKHKIFNSKNLHTIMDIFNIKRNIIQLRNLSLVSTFDISENYYTKKNCIQPRISPWKFIKNNKKKEKYKIIIINNTKTLTCVGTMYTEYV